MQALGIMFLILCNVVVIALCLAAKVEESYTAGFAASALYQTSFQLIGMVAYLMGKVYKDPFIEVNRDKTTVMMSIF